MANEVLLLGVEFDTRKAIQSINEANRRLDSLEAASNRVTASTDKWQQGIKNLRQQQDPWARGMVNLRAQTENLTGGLGRASSGIQRFDSRMGSNLGRLARWTSSIQGGTFTLGRLGNGLSGMGSTLGIVTLAIGVAAVAWGVLRKSQEKAREEAKKHEAALKQLQERLEKLRLEGRAGALGVSTTVLESQEAITAALEKQRLLLLDREKIEESGSEATARALQLNDERLNALNKELFFQRSILKAIEENRKAEEARNRVIKERAKDLAERQRPAAERFLEGRDRLAAAQQVLGAPVPVVIVGSPFARGGPGGTPGEAPVTDFWAVVDAEGRKLAGDFAVLDAQTRIMTEEQRKFTEAQRRQEDAMNALQNTLLHVAPSLGDFGKGLQVLAVVLDVLKVIQEFEAAARIKQTTALDVQTAANADATDQVRKMGDQVRKMGDAAEDTRKRLEKLGLGPLETQSLPPGGIFELMGRDLRLPAREFFDPVPFFPFYQKGGIVPGPINAPQLAVVHGGEEVIPVGSRREGTTVHTNVTFQVSAIDAQDVEQFFVRNSGLLARQIAREAARSSGLRRHLSRN